MELAGLLHTAVKRAEDIYSIYSSLSAPVTKLDNKAARNEEIHEHFQNMETNKKPDMTKCLLFGVLLHNVVITLIILMVHHKAIQVILLWVIFGTIFLLFKADGARSVYTDEPSVNVVNQSTIPAAINTASNLKEEKRFGSRNTKKRQKTIKK